MLKPLLIFGLCIANVSTIDASGNFNHALFFGASATGTVLTTTALLYAAQACDTKFKFSGALFELIRKIIFVRAALRMTANTYETLEAPTLLTRPLHFLKNGFTVGICNPEASLQYRFSEVRRDYLREKINQTAFLISSIGRTFLTTTGLLFLAGNYLSNTAFPFLRLLIILRAGASIVENSYCFYNSPLHFDTISQACRVGLIMGAAGIEIEKAMPSFLATYRTPRAI